MDPFSGTGTTGVAAAESGIRAVLFDINPFLVWLAKAKCYQYTEADIDDAILMSTEIVNGYKRHINKQNWLPRIFNIERWWSERTLRCLGALCEELKKVAGGAQDSKGPAALLWVAFCRLAIDVSSVSFNHVSMSFSDSVTSHEDEVVEELFTGLVAQISQEASKPLPGQVEILNTDSCVLSADLNIRANTVITSPPYPNRMSYIRELRPYMYWTGFLDEAKEAAQLDWKTMGGTWGTATLGGYDNQDTKNTITEIDDALRMIV